MLEVYARRFSAEPWQLMTIRPVGNTPAFLVRLRELGFYVAVVRHTEVQTWT